MKSYFLVILTFFIVHLGFQADAQNLEILAEHDFIEILAGIHPKQDSFLLTDEKFNEKGELVLFQQIKIENKIIVAEDFFLLPDTNEAGEQKTTTSVLEYLLAKDSTLELMDNYILQDLPINIYNSAFYNLKLDGFNFSNIFFANSDFTSGLIITNSKITNLSFDFDENYIAKTESFQQILPNYFISNSEVQNFNFSPKTIGNLSIKKTKIEVAELYAKSANRSLIFEDNNPIYFSIDSSKIEKSMLCFSSKNNENRAEIPQNLELNYQITNSTIVQFFDTNLTNLEKRSYLKIGLNPLSSLNINTSKFSSNNKNLPFVIVGNSKDLLIENSLIEVPIVYNFSEVYHELSIRNSLLSGISLFRTSFPLNKYFVYADWDVLSQNLSLIIPNKWLINENGMLDSNSINPFVFNPIQSINSDSIVLYPELIATYQNWIDIYKTRGDRISADRSYVEMREIETQKLATDYQSQKKLKKLFQLRFNQLLFFTSDYGSNPLLVLFNVFFVIVFFGFVFILVPNEIDTSGAKPLGKVLLQVWFAFDQSLRAFLTFGKSDNTFPFARFIALIEGLFGWFLIILFAVSLLYQAMI